MYNVIRAINVFKDGAFRPASRQLVGIAKSGVIIWTSSDISTHSVRTSDLEVKKRQLGIRNPDVLALKDGAPEIMNSHVQPSRRSHSAV